MTNLHVIWLLCVGWLIASCQAATIAAGQDFFCAVTFNWQLKCWGGNYYAQLGQGHTQTIGDNSNEMGESLPPINLGTGRSVTAFAAGQSHVCAILDNGLVKCWGRNQHGQLGQGHSTSIGGSIGQMGDNLPYTDLGTDRKAVQISAGVAHTCAILDNGQLKCWGGIGIGELGQGHSSTIGNLPNQMGDNLRPTDLGTGRTAVQVAAGEFHTCAILDNGLVKCWGYGTDGQLGNGLLSTFPGSKPNEMGDNLTYTDLGTGRSAVQIFAGDVHTCALLDNEQVKCWGNGGDGALGQGNPSDIGRIAYQMGDYLPAVNLGMGRIAVQISAGRVNSCAVFVDGRAKCWGENAYGQLGIGSSSFNRMGDQPGEMGENLPDVFIPPGRKIKEVSLGVYNGCARLDNGDVKCWGYNNGMLGQGNTESTVQMGNGKPVSINECTTLDCGPLARCIDQPEIGESTCKCEEGHWYDTIIMRDTANFYDFDSYGKLQVRCEHLCEYWADKWQLESCAFGPSFPIPYDGIIPGNMTLVVTLQERSKYVYNGQEFYIIVKSMENNVTLASDRFILPCGCDATAFLDFPPIFPRIDDGRPIPRRIVQRQGRMYVSWMDNSICATQFSLHRVLVDNATASLMSVFDDDAELRSFKFSNLVQLKVNSGELSSVSVVSDFLLDATTCFKKFAPLQFFDDMIRSRLAFGTKVYYCMTASNPSLGYTSAYSCANKLYSLFEEEEDEYQPLPDPETCIDCRRLSDGSGLPMLSFIASGAFFWETTLKVTVLVGKYSNTPESNVQITWQVMLDSGQEIILAKDNFGTTDVNGEVELHIIASSEQNLMLRQNSALSVSIFASKTTNLPTGQVEHKFTCQEPARECSQSKPLITEAGHLAIGQNYVFRDITQVAISGKVTIDGTQNADFGVPLGCPLQGAEVCAYAADMEQTERNKIDCFTSTATGEFAVIVPMQSWVELTISLQDPTAGMQHTFVPQGWEWQVFKVGISNIQNINFVDVTKETLYIDVYGGDCRLPLASRLGVELSKKRSGCGTWSREFYSEDHVIPPETMSPTTIPTASPSLPTPQPTMSRDSPTSRNPTTKTPSKSPSFSPIESWVITNHPTRFPSLSPTKKPTTGQPTTTRPTASPTVATRFVRYRLEVPATSFEVSIVDLSGPHHETELDGLVEYFANSPYLTVNSKEQST